MTDISFAQDQLGNQFLFRDGKVVRLSAASGEIDAITPSLKDFFTQLSVDIENFLNIGLEYLMQPGQLLLAYPHFIFRESGVGTSLKSVQAEEVIL